ncbi:MAG: hypothetical protein R2856_13125 [Caldilineaceae bacterium]
MNRIGCASSAWTPGAPSSRCLGPKPTDEAFRRRTCLTGFDLKNFAPFATPGDVVSHDELSPILQNELSEMESAASLIFQDGGLHYSVENQIQ